MFFLLKIISGLAIGSILGVLFCLQTNYVPRYLKRKYNIAMQGVHTVIVTIVITFLSFFGVYLSWVTLIGLSFFVWIFSAWFTKDLAQKRGESLERNSPVTQPM